MAQTTLLSGISSPTTGPWIYVGPANSLTLQGSPQGSQPFTGTICIDVAAVPNTGAGLYFPIATLNSSPWYQFVMLIFSTHQSSLVFKLALPGNFTWIRARPTLVKSGSANLYAAY